MSTTVQHQGRSCGRRLWVVKGTLVLAIMLVPTDHYPVVTDPFWAQVAELATLDGEFIGPVAIDGNTLVGGGAKGAACVFVKAATGWADATQTAKLTTSDREPIGSVGISGNTVVGLGPTAVYVFVEPASGWADMTETAQLSVLDPEGPDGLGFNVGISGDTVVAGNPNARSAQGPSSGAAYVWVKPASGWADMTQTAKLTAPDGVGALGVSVSISGNTVVAGATGTGSSPKGAAYVFVEPPTGWADMTQTATLTPSNGAAGDSFGVSVAISDNTVVAGRLSGAPVPAYVFVQPETGWVNMTQTARLTRSDQAQREFGFSVAISGNTVVVGAPADPSGGNPYPGAAYVFTEPAGGWANMTETASVTDGGGADFGLAAAISESTVVISDEEAYVFQPSPVPGQTYTLLHDFNASDGAGPSSGLIRDTSGNLYGTTYSGGGTGKGVVFRLDASGTETVLHEFGSAAPKNDGANPAAGLSRDTAGNLYGTTVNGGASGLGTVFEFTAKHFETVLHSFGGYPTDGAYPYAGLTRDSAGNLYGTTSAGGAFGDGVVFKLTPTGRETVLHNFTGGADGGNPYGGPIRDAAGNLYGTTSFGGSSPCSSGTGCGVVFKLDTTGKDTVLYSFHGTDGANPHAGLIRDAAGNLYGTTEYGGASGNGVVFKVDTTGKESVLYSFTGGFDGGNPYATLVRDAAGNLYGTTTYGNSGNGVVFELDTSGKETVLHSFSPEGLDGINPTARLLRDAAGNLYGTAPSGGVGQSGVIFKLTP